MSVDLETKHTKFISFSNLAGGDAVQGLLRVIQLLSKKNSVAVVELPCLGLPRLSYVLGKDEVLKLEKERSVDQLLIDYERKLLKPLGDYILKSGGVDYLLVHPKSLPEAPVIRKLESNMPLIQTPFYLQQQLKGKYDYVFMLTQGRLIHPMTFFAIRSADAAVLYCSETADFVQNYTHYKKLREIFGMVDKRLFLFAQDHNISSLDTATVYSKDVTKMIKAIDSLDSLSLDIGKSDEDPIRKDESIGVIDPLEYLDYQVRLSNVTRDLSIDDQKLLESLQNYVRGQLTKHHLDEYVKSLTNEQVRQKIKYHIADIVREQSEIPISLPINEVIEWVQKEITELGVIQGILDNPRVSSIEVNGPDRIIVEIDGQDVHMKDIRFRDNQHLIQTINKILLPIGKPISSTEPVVDANYRGFRICVVADNKEFQGLSSGSPLISIRKFPPRVYSNDECVSYGNISQEIVDFQEFAVPTGANIIVVGPTNSGKTTQLIRLPLFVDPLTRIISIEDSEEMMLASKEQYLHYPNLPSLLVKQTEDEAKSYGIDKLIKACLRLRPEVLCIGEIRDELAARQSLVGMNTGHTVWLTIHANSASEGAVRFLQLNGNNAAAASQIASSIDLIMFQKKMANGVRVVTEISELISFNGTEKPVLNPIFKYDFSKGKHKRVGSVKSKSWIEKMMMKGTNEEDMSRWCDKEALEEDMNLGCEKEALILA
ncbi:ATPase, T2SS/T4P/T4SS family [Paenibacillus lautus]|uniref:ATPase, T2SS/T4P/T4SS family n=1 Tax=Paenibacillus lautus TaxID=1401 RepID=UPI003D2E0216